MDTTTKNKPEQQEWTPERLINEIGWHPDGRCFEKVAKEITDSLATERDITKGTYRALELDNKGLRQQLAAEVQRRERAEQMWERAVKAGEGLESQLLSALAFKSFVHRRLDMASVPTAFPDGVRTKEGCRIGDRLDWLVERTVSALAAIEKHNKDCQTAYGYRGEIKVDLSPLREHDAVMLSCRDHWKTSFEHERENVVRLRRIVYDFHGGNCVCRDCEIVKSGGTKAQREPAIPSKPSDFAVSLNTLDLTSHDAEVRKPLVEALEFYANKENWVNDVEGMPDGYSSEVEGSSEINQDSGDKAREALAKEGK